MNNQENVSSLQMSMLFLAYLTGSSIVNIPAPLTGAAKNGALISLMFAWAIGMLLLACLLYLHRQYPGLNFIEYSLDAIGKWMTVIVAIPFICTLFWMVSAIVIDIGGFFSNTMLKDTPSYFIHFLFFLISALTARAGIEVMARMFILLLLLMFGFIIAIWVLVAPYYHPEYLLPLMPDGIKPILHGTYIALGFPYGELTLFVMMLPFVRKKDERTIGKYMFFAIIVNCITLMVSIASAIMTVGPLAGELKYSLYQLARLIFIQEILERVESVVGFSLIAGSYMKATIVLFILTKISSQFLKLQDDRILTIPIAFVCLLLSITMYTNETSFVKDLNVIWPLFSNVTFNLPLILITAVTIFKRRKGNSHGSKE